MDVHRVSPTVTTITTTANGTAVRFLHPCRATTVDGCLVKQNASSSTPGFSLAMLAFLVMIMGGKAAAPEPKSDLVYSYDNMTSAIDAITEMAISSKEKFTNQVFFVGEELFGISDFCLEYPRAAAAEGAASAPLCATWTIYRTLEQGTEFRGWQPASCVHVNKDKEAKPVTLVQSSAYLANCDGHYNYDYGLRASAAFGHDAKKDNIFTQSKKYVIPAQNCGQVWSQQILVWQDQQRQHCHTICGSGEIDCGLWRRSARCRMPLENGQTFEWSTGDGLMYYESCGGGT